jgi:hypothetical protein
MTKERDIFKKSDEIHMASFSKAKPTEFLAGSYVLVKPTGGHRAGYIVPCTMTPRMLRNIERGHEYISGTSKNRVLSKQRFYNGIF